MDGRDLLATPAKDFYLHIFSDMYFFFYLCCVFSFFRIEGGGKRKNKTKWRPSLETERQRKGVRKKKKKRNAHVLQLPELDRLVHFNDNVFQ